MRRLAVNADDFGFTRDVNRGIVQAHREGIVTATTVMATGAAFDDAVVLARENPTLDIGCHLVLVGGRSLADPSRELPPTVARLVAALATGGVRPYEEFSAQVRRIVDAGLRPTHIDSHKHTHTLPMVLAAAARVSREFGIPWVRRPLAPAGWLLNPMLRRYGCRTTDHFLGFRMTGRFHTRELVGMLRRLPEGLTEFMCHPGFCTAELRSARTRLLEQRVRELEALTSPEARRAIDESGIELVNYREL